MLLLIDCQLFADVSAYFVHIVGVKQSTKIVLALPDPFEDSAAIFRMPVTVYESTNITSQKILVPSSTSPRTSNLAI